MLSTLSVLKRFKSDQCNNDNMILAWKKLPVLNSGTTTNFDSASTCMYMGFDGMMTQAKGFCTNTPGRRIIIPPM